MSAADILRNAGFVPVVPEVSRQTGTPAALAPQRVPVVPPVPVQKNEGETRRRVIVKFRLVSDPPTTQAVALGAPGLTRAEIVADLLQRYHDRVVIRPEPEP